MHDLKFLRTNRERVEAGVALKGMPVDLARFYQIEERRLTVLHETEQLKARRNSASEEIAAKKKQRGKCGQPKSPRCARSGIGSRRSTPSSSGWKRRASSSRRGFRSFRTPRCRPGATPHRTRWCGRGRAGEVRISRPAALGDRESLGLLDFERASKIAGSGFLCSPGSAPARARADRLHARLPHHAARLP